MLKKYFDWTPSDIAEWEKLRAKGLGRFVVWYGIKLFAGWLFLIVAAGVVFFWARAALQTRSTNFPGLALELLFAAAVCLVGGLIAALSTWALEENIYRKIKGEGGGGK